jgi:hypothetical protein
MTATTPTPTVSTPSLRGRTLNVIRLQFINRWTFIWVPLLVLGGSWVISMLIYLIIAGNGVDGPMYGGGAQAPLWYFTAVGVQAMAYTFPFSQAMSLTRREFFVGSTAAAAVSALGMTAVIVLLGMIEEATGGYGINAYFGYVPFVWDQGPLAAGMLFFGLILLLFTIGFWCATVYKRYGTAVLVGGILAVALVLVGVVALLTWNELWPRVGRLLVDLGAVGLGISALVLTVVLGALS